jgi:hypothetical protein
MSRGNPARKLTDIDRKMKTINAPEIKPVNLYRACYGKWQSWNDETTNHAEWDDTDRIFAADDEIEAKWIANTDPILLNGYQLQMIERLVAVPIDPIAADEF